MCDLQSLPALNALGTNGGKPSPCLFYDPAKVRKGIPFFCRLLFVLLVLSNVKQDTCGLFTDNCNG